MDNDMARTEGAAWDAVAEIAWIAREARLLSGAVVPPEGSCERPYWQGRWDRFTARKMALLAYVDATREGA